MRKRWPNSRGFTFVELIIWGSVSSIVMLGLSKISLTQTKLSSRINHNQQERTLDKAVETIMVDFQEASYQSVSSRLTATPSQTIEFFAKYRYEGTAKKTVSVKYSYDAARATLWRYENNTINPTDATSAKTIVLTHVHPEFSLDPSPNSSIVILKLMYTPPGAAIAGLPGSATITVNERVSVRG